MRQNTGLRATRGGALAFFHGALLSVLMASCTADTPSSDARNQQPSAGVIGLAAGGSAGTVVTSPIAGVTAQVTGGMSGVAANGGIAGISAGGMVVAGTLSSAAGRSGAPAAGSSAGAAAGSGAAGAVAPGSCAEPPTGTAAPQVAALDAVNKLRIASGSGCATFVQTIADGATKHCEYYAANSADMMCIADPHSEVSTCMGFTGKSFSDRIKATGYTGIPAFEVMAFLNDPVRSVSTWVNSVWHRIPVLSPWVTELGYGAAARCDTIDFGRGKPLPDTTIVVYPYDGETDIPISFDGSREGPMPPTPSTGKWPSGPPISLYAKKMMITDHVLTKDGDTTPITHTWLDAATADAMFKGFLTDVAFMYSDSPLTAATKYRVHIKGTSVSGALDREWTFTTH